MSQESESLTITIARNIALFYPAEAKALINDQLPDGGLETVLEANWHCESLAPIMMGDATPDERDGLAESLLAMIEKRDSGGIRRIADFIDRVNAGRDKVEQFAPALHFVEIFRKMQGRLPTKRELKKILLQSKARCPSEDDNKGWARLFETAGLKEKLPKGKPHRGASRNGTLKRKRKPPTK
jgi:hypothetical protein